MKTRIKNALEEMGIPMVRLAERLGIAPGSVSEMFKKVGDPPVSYILATRELTGYNLEWLLTGSGPRFTGDDVRVVNEDLAPYHKKERDVYRLIEALERRVQKLEAELEDLKRSMVS